MTGELQSWGRYPYIDQQGYDCSWRSDIKSALSMLSSQFGSTLPFGNGRSYGDSCLAESGHALVLSRLDRFIHVDWEQGCLIAEAGVTLGELLSLSIPNGWFLSVTPGTKYVTLGGAIANDVHGKNHHRRGTFGSHLRRFGLQRTGEYELICSPDENPELFSATIGGLGLTGVITWAEIQLMPITSGKVTSAVRRFGNLNDFFALSREMDHKHEYSVAWIDCLAKGMNAGRGVFMVGDHASDGNLFEKPRKKVAVPVTPPFSLINNVSLKIFNEAYWRAHPSELTQQVLDYEPFFYPLDRILNWNRIYGRKGFQQYQCVIPDDHAESAIRELLNTISKSGQGSFLAVLKRCGDMPSPGLLSFPFSGASLALDFPQTSSLETELFPKLDSIVKEAKGRLYPAKDAHMSGSDFRASYPGWEILETLRDKSIMSNFWRRVTA